MEDIEAGLCEDATIFLEAFDSDSIYFGYYDLGFSWAGDVYCFGEEKTMLFQYSSNALVGSSVSILDESVLLEDRDVYMAEKEVYEGFNHISAERVRATLNR